MFDGGVVEELTGLVDRLANLPAASDDGERIDRIAALEKLGAAVSAAQMSEVAAFAASQEAANKAPGQPRESASEVSKNGRAPGMVLQSDW